MYQEDRELSSTTIINFAGLRQLCLTRFWQDAEANPTKGPSVFEARDKTALATLFSKAIEIHRSQEDNPLGYDWRSNEGLLIIQRDIDSLEVPMSKWALLASWCTPESAAGHCPQLVSDIVLSCIKGTLGRSI